MTNSVSQLGRWKYWVDVISTLAEYQFTFYMYWRIKNNSIKSIIPWLNGFKIIKINKIIFDRLTRFLNSKRPKPVETSIGTK